MILLCFDFLRVVAQISDIGRLCSTPGGPGSPISAENEQIDSFFFCQDTSLREEICGTTLTSVKKTYEC